MNKHEVGTLFVKNIAKVNMYIHIFPFYLFTPSSPLSLNFNKV